MNFKEFFWPTKAKIVLSFLFSIFLFVPVKKDVICPFVPPCFTAWYSIFDILLGFGNATILTVIFGLIVIYLIASICVFGYKKYSDS